MGKFRCIKLSVQQGRDPPNRPNDDGPIELSFDGGAMKKDGLRVKTEEILAQRHLFFLVRYSLILTILDKTTSSLAIHASCRLGSGLFAV